MESRSFPLGVILSLTTGRLLCEFSEMHGAAEFILGHPVWSHEFADRNLFDRMKAAVLEQHLDLDAVNADGVDAGNWEAWLKDQHVRYGDTREVRKGDGDRTESPLESLERIAPGKPVVAIVAE